MADRWASIIVLPNQTIQVGESKYTANEMGQIDIEESMIFVSNLSSIDRYETEINQMINNEKQEMVYRAMGKSVNIMLSTIADIVGGKDLARAILNMGVRYGVLHKSYNCTWKISEKVVKERMIDRANQIERDLKGRPKTQDELIAESIKESKEAQPSEETRSVDDDEVAYEPKEGEMSIRESISQQTRKPLLPVPSAKKQTLPKKKPALSKTLVKSPKAH